MNKRFNSTMLVLNLVAIFLLMGVLCPSKQTLNEPEDVLRVFTYKVKRYENLAMVADKFNLTEYTIKSSNLLYNKKLKWGKKLILPNQNVTIYKYPRRSHLRRIAYKFYIKIKDISVFTKYLVPIKVVDEDDFLPLGGYVAVPQLQEKNFVFPLMCQDGAENVFSGYGRRRNPLMRWGFQFHTGWDILTKYKHVKAAKSGRVIFSGWLGGYGRCIIIEHTNMERTIYAHMSRLFFRRGTYAKQGVSLGVSGSTGHSTGPHLHFEVRRNNIPVNPMNEIWERKLARQEDLEGRV